MKKYLLAAALAGASCVPAYAGLVDWNISDHPGLLGTTQNFTASGDILSARGFDGADVGTRLFSKQNGGDENGLGLNNDPTGDDEISGRNFIQLNVDQAISEKVSGFNFTMDSSTAGEKWAVFGSNDAHPFTFTLLASGSDEGVLHNLASGWDNYNFFYNGPANGVGGANVLIGSFGGTQSTVPEPSTWVMGIVGFAILGAMGWRKARAASIAA
jgi:hypothetical protein